MSIYTTFDMIADCRENQPAAWMHFLTHFLEPCRKVIAHYGGREQQVHAFLEAVKAELPKCSPVSERELMVRLRPLMIQFADFRSDRDAPDFEPFEQALAGLTLVEKQIVWFETMRYNAGETAAILRVAPDTVARTLSKTGELLRGALDDWSISLLRECGPALHETVRGAETGERVPFRAFIEIIDGKLNWYDRAPVEKQITQSWMEIDQFCLIREADDAVRSFEPGQPEQVTNYFGIFGLQLPKKPLWKRLMVS